MDRLQKLEAKSGNKGRTNMNWVPDTVSDTLLNHCCLDGDWTGDVSTMAWMPSGPRLNAWGCHLGQEVASTKQLLHDRYFHS